MDIAKWTPRSWSPAAARIQQLHLTGLLLNSLVSILKLVWAFLPLRLKWPETWSRKTVFFSRSAYHKASKLYNLWPDSSLRWKIQTAEVWKQAYSQPMGGRHALSSNPVFPASSILRLLGSKEILASNSLSPTAFEACLWVCSLQKAATCCSLVVCPCAAGSLPALPPPPAPPATSWLWKVSPDRVSPAALGVEGNSFSATALPASMGQLSSLPLCCLAMCSLRKYLSTNRVNNHNSVAYPQGPPVMLCWKKKWHWKLFLMPLHAVINQRTMKGIQSF